MVEFLLPSPSFEFCLYCVSGPWINATEFHTDVLLARKISLAARKDRVRIYLHAPTQGCIATDQRIESVGLFLASFAGTKGISGTQGTTDEKGKSLEAEDCLQTSHLTNLQSHPKLRRLEFGLRLLIRSHLPCFGTGKSQIVHQLI
jgi:hypothetical protein